MSKDDVLYDDYEQLMFNGFRFQLLNLSERRHDITKQNPRVSLCTIYLHNLFILYLFTFLFHSSCQLVVLELILCMCAFMTGAGFWLA